jgi:hypothetical protein
MEQFAANGHNADRLLCPRVHNLVSTTGHFGKFREWLKGVGLHGDGECHRLLGLHVEAGNFVALAKIYLEFFNYKCSEACIIFNNLISSVLHSPISHIRP